MGIYCEAFIKFIIQLVKLFLQLFFIKNFQTNTTGKKSTSKEIAMPCTFVRFYRMKINRASLDTSSAGDEDVMIRVLTAAWVSIVCDCSLRNLTLLYTAYTKILKWCDDMLEKEYWIT